MLKTNSQLFFFLTWMYNNQWWCLEYGKEKLWKSLLKNCESLLFIGITDSMDMTSSKLRETVKDRKPGVLQSMGLQRVRHDNNNNLLIELDCGVSQK